MEPLAERGRGYPADVSGVRVIDTGYGHEQQHFPRARGNGRQRPLDAALELTGRSGLERRRRGAVQAERPERDQARRRRERHLALMRPLSVAGLFAAMTGGVLGFINVLRFVWTRELTAETYRVMAVGAAESLVPISVGFASLTVAWLLVAVGMGRGGPRL